MLATAAKSPTVVPGKFHPLVAHYFDCLNQGDYLGVSRLFSPEGRLLPPFEEEIIGPRAIARYLRKEAQGIQCIPHQEADVHTLADGSSQREILGKVHTSLFSVNVAWTFTCADEQTLQQVSIKLLASPEELLNLQSQAS
ncbi:ketosteroid isomerase family protein [Spirulina sp. CS-785/01]|uniref:ketosteroid isomerase family protein n=1 Tax=Spirulina sp. CS-785/01 TaxID=3021716 RepID=UPI00232C7FBF|nr:ketosteroid isomerase family protein [Spirulina sp. CS-785/01]MDB9314715.1 ketosteroid isomerase family protein [Spirulina sp. CS-785/01]